MSVETRNSEILDLADQLSSLSQRFVKATNDLGRWKLNFDMVVNPVDSVVELKVYKDGNVAGIIKTLTFDDILEFADDIDTLANEVSDQIIELLLQPQIRTAVKQKLNDALPNVIKINATR